MNYERIYDNIRFRIDREKYFENYIEIRRTCIMEGYAPPQYLDELLLEIPDVHYVEGDDDFEYLLTDEARERLEETLMSRRREDVKLIRMKSESDQENRLIDIYNRELEEFFEKFPQFKIILREE